jgi:hypothetical protein
MASLQDFVGEISVVHGVRGYLVLRRDGQILSQNVRPAERLSTMVVLAGLSCESIITATRLSRFRCLVLARGKKEKLLIFPAQQCFLLVIEGADVYTPDLLRRVEEIMQTSSPF